MHTVPLALVAAASLANVAHADFSIWYSITATAGDPGGPQWSAVFVPYLDSGVACADLDSGIVRYAQFADVTPQFGGANCDGCENGIEPTRFEYWDGPNDFENAIMSESFGYITLRPQEGSDDWYFEYINPDRTEQGVLTNSRCVRAEGSYTCSIGVATRTGAKLFDCFTSIQVIPSNRD